MRAELVAAANFGERSWCRRAWGDGWLVQSNRDELLVANEGLVVRERFPLPSSWRGVHAVGPRMDCAAISDRDRVLLIDRQGHVIWQAGHHPWGDGDSETGSCWISPDGLRVWATVATPDGPDQWWVLDARDGKLLAVAQLACMAAGSNAVPHPDGRHVGLSVGEGQDGAELYWGHWEEDHPVVSRLDDRSRVLVDVRPDGSQYLTTPHSSDTSSAMRIHRFPDGRTLAQLEAASALPQDDWFDLVAGYLTNDVVLVASVENQIHLLLCADTLSVVGQIEYPTPAAKENIAPTGRGTWLTSDYLVGLHQVWRLADEA